MNPIQKALAELYTALVDQGIPMSIDCLTMTQVIAGGLEHLGPTDDDGEPDEELDSACCTIAAALYEHGVEPFLEKANGP